MTRIFAVISCITFFRNVHCSVPCVKGAASLLKSPLVQVSPCHINFDSPSKPTERPPEAKHSATSLHTTELPRVVTTMHGFPAIFAASHVYVSTNRFLDRPVCLTQDLLPTDLASAPLTGAGFSRNYLFLLFGRHVVRVGVIHLVRWLAGDRSSYVLDVKSFSDAMPSASRIVSTPCCDETTWCKHANGHIAAYSPEARGTAVTLMTSWDEGGTYYRQPVRVPSGSKPLLFSQYPSEEYGTLFFNHGGKGFVTRIPHWCHQLPEGSAAGQRDGPDCRHSPLQVCDHQIRTVTVQLTMRMLTMLVTEESRLLISGRADTHFEPATFLDAASLKVLGEEVEVHLPLRAFATDGERWMLIDADKHVMLGSSLDVWTSRVIRLRLGNITSDSISPPLPSPSSSTANTSVTNTAKPSSGVAVAANGPHQVFVVRGRTVEVLSVTEPSGGGGTLSCSLRRASLSRQLAPLDAQCEVLQLTAVSRSHQEPMVDKSDTLRLDVRLSSVAHMAVRPLVLFSSNALVSETQLLGSRARPDGAVTSRWLVTVRSHPQVRRRPFMRQLQLAQLHVTSTAAQAECPARRPPAIPVLVGCNPWLNLTARNKRVSKDTCHHLQKVGLRLASSPERDPLMRYQQRVRGERAVRLENGQWHVSWDDAWGCPLLSSDKAQFTPVLAVKNGDQRRPLRQATAMHEIHGVHDFGFGLTAAAVGCRSHDRAEAVSWWSVYTRLLKHGNLSSEFDPSAVLNTASYVSCNASTGQLRRFAPDPELATQAPESISFQLFGMPDHNNSIFWQDSAEIHVFNFRVVDPLFTYCDLNLTVAVFFMHSSDVKQKTKLTILLVGVGLSLLAVVLGHITQQVMRSMRLEKQQQLDLLLTAADAFVWAADAHQWPQKQELPPLDPTRHSGHNISDGPDPAQQ